MKGYAAFLVLVLAGSGCGQAQSADPKVEERISNPPIEAVGDQTLSDSQTITEGAADPTGRPSSSKGSAATMGSAKASRSWGSISDPATSGTAEGAGPPVFYTDQADDAHGTDASPNAALSQSAFDILRVDWAPASGGYSTSITVAGAGQDDGSYVSYGFFDAGGERCRIYYLLTPGKGAYSHAFCDSSDGRVRFLGGQEGSEVLSTPTSAGGTRLSATFDDRSLPTLLKAAGQTLHNLSAFTCDQVADDPTAPDRYSTYGLYCGDYRVLDWVSSTLTYRL